MYDKIAKAAETVLEQGGVIPNRLRAHPLTMNKIKAEVEGHNFFIHRGHMGILLPIGQLMLESDPEAPQDNIYIDRV